MADKKISQLTAATVPLAGTEVLPVVQGGSTVKVAVSDLTAGRNTAVAGLTATPSGAYQSVGIGAGSTYGIISFNGAFGVNSSIGIAGGANGDNAAYLLSPSNIYGRIGSSNITNTSSTGFTVVGDMYATNNFVVGTAGKGIDFSANANAPGMTSEVLTWYEEGNWTPSVAATSGTITTLGAVSGTYTRIGRRVFVTFSVAITTNGTGTQAVRVSDLPFAISGFGSGSGRENGVNGYMIQSAGFNGNTYFDLLTASGGYPGGDGYLLQGFIEYNA